MTKIIIILRAGSTSENQKVMIIAISIVCTNHTIMRHYTVTTPISDAARYFSNRQSDVGQPRPKKSSKEKFTYPSFEHVHAHHSRRH